jgi:hypothetical protein
MLPYILAAVGGYLIGDSMKADQYADGGMMADGGEIKVGDKVKYKNAKYHATIIEIVDDVEIPYAEIAYSDGSVKKAYLEDLQKVALGVANEYVNPKYMSDGGMMAADGGQVYKLGDKWSSNFDYTGMLKTALKADVSWGVNKLRKLYDSFEDVNYHTASRSLWKAIESLKNSDVKDAEKHLEHFRSDVTEELNS